jgi:glycerate-2-kinase
MQKMTPINRSHVKMMLMANDVPGLKAAAEGSQPLRSYATGLKMAEHVLARHGVEQLPPRVRAVLEEMKSLYDSNPQLVSLGDQRAFSEAQPRSKQDVQVLMSAFDKADTLVHRLKSALSDGGMGFSDLALRA